MVHIITNYDLLERASAVKDGYDTEFTLKELTDSGLLNNKSFKIVDSYGKIAVVRKVETKSKWEDLFN